MRRLVVLLVVAAVAACDPSPPADPAVAPPLAGGHTAAPTLAAAEPVAPSLQEFAAEATAACAAATAVLNAAPLHGDPLTSYATRRDVRAAVQHYNAAARAWSDAAGDLFAFGPPEDGRGQRLIAALDVLAMRSRQVAQALAGGDDESAQSALGAVEQALFEADLAARDLGVGPLEECGAVARRNAGRPRVVVKAVDFDFHVLSQGLKAGMTRLVLRNRGSEDHQLFLVPLREPGTLTAAVAADRRGESPEAFVAGQGAATAVARPGERTMLDVELDAGAYGFLCYVASPDGTPHAWKGMATEVAVQG